MRMIKYVSILLLFSGLTNIAGIKAQRKIALNPDFKNNLSWQQTVKAVSSWNYNGTTQKQIIDLTMHAEIVEWKNARPVKIIYDKVKGPQIIIVVDEQKETEKEKWINHDGKITSDINVDYTLYNSKDHGALSDDILSSFPPGPLIGFIPPEKKKVKVGYNWDSGNIIPLGPKTFSKNKFQFYDMKGEFTLKKIEEDLARISWKGETKVKTKSAEVLNAKWQRIVVFDWKNHRFISNKGEMQINGADWNIVYHVEIIAKY